MMRIKDPLEVAVEDDQFGMGQAEPNLFFQVIDPFGGANVLHSERRFGSDSSVVLHRHSRIVPCLPMHDGGGTVLSPTAIPADQFG